MRQDRGTEEKALRTVVSGLREIAQERETDARELMYALILSGLAMQMVGKFPPGLLRGTSSVSSVGDGSDQ